jgi:hypothetical protein
VSQSHLYYCDRDFKVHKMPYKEEER